MHESRPLFTYSHGGLQTRKLAREQTALFLALQKEVTQVALWVISGYDKKSRIFFRNPSNIEFLISFVEI